MGVKRKLTKGREIVHDLEEVFSQFLEEKAALNKSPATLTSYKWSFAATSAHNTSIPTNNRQRAKKMVK